jgi:DNA-binding NtrC family response regulator
VYQGRERVLFVDDEIDLTEVAQRGLTRFGYKVQVFNDPTKALAAFQACPRDFDIVITDITMPGFTGEVLAAHVKSLRPDIPVLLVSGYSDRLTPEQSRAAGFDGFVDKPLRPTRLAQLIRQLCSAR